jgi:hypothetical protein
MVGEFNSMISDVLTSDLFYFRHLVHNSSDFNHIIDVFHKIKCA